MSSAFVRENEEQWLNEIAPTVTALISYLTKENNGVRVYEKRQSVDTNTGKEVFEMSNGLYYTKDQAGRWEIKW